MKLNTQFKATLVAIEKNKSVDGQNEYYKLAVLQGAEATSISCTKEVYDTAPELFKEYGFALQIGEYSGKPTFRVTSIYKLSSTDNTAPLGSSGTTTPGTTLPGEDKPKNK